MIKFAICFHHTSEDMEIWRKFANYLALKLGEDVELVTYANFYEEQQRSTEEDYDLIFQNPETVFILLQRGYKPIARFNEQWDTVYYISKKDFNKTKNYIKVGIVPLRVIYSTLLELEKNGFDINNIEFKVYSNLKQIHDALLAGEIDIGITRKDTFSRLPSEFTSQMNILLEFGMGIFHSFMVKSDNVAFEKRITEVLFFMHKDPYGKILLENLDSDKIVGIGYEFKFLDRLNSIGERIFEFRNFKSFFNALDQVPNVGVVIFGKYVKYMNKFAEKVLGYSDYLKNLETIQIFDDDVRSDVARNIERRLNGEKFDVRYNHIKMKAKDGSKIDVMGFASTIIFQGSPSGVFIFIDIRKRLFLEKMFYAIKEINHIIIYSQDREDLFAKLISMIIEQVGFNYCRIINFKSHETSLYNFGTPLKNISNVVPENETISIEIINDENGDIVGLIFIVPIYVNGKLDSTLEIHTNRYLDYINEISILMDELKRDVAFIIDKIDKDFKALSFYNAIKSSKDFCFITDRLGNITYVNSAVLEISKFSEEEIIGKKPSIFKSDKMGKDFYDEFYSKIYSGEQFNGIFINRSKDGSLFYLEASVLPIIKKGDIKGFVFIGKNITDELLLKSEMEKIRYEDHLTKLNNFLGFTTKSREFTINNPDSICAVIMFDINNMSYINNSYGYHFGDSVLIRIAEEIKSIVKQRDILARIGGDDFGIFIANMKKKENIFKIVDRLVNLFNKKLTIDGIDVSIQPKIAVVLYPYDGRDINDLMNKCSLTLSKIRKQETLIQFYDTDLKDEADKFLEIETLISTAVDENRFVLHYQPYFYSSDLELAGFEALIRMYDRKGNLLYPNAFIDHLEQSIYNDRFEEWLIEQTDRIIGEMNYPVSINISAKNLNYNNFVNKMKLLSEKNLSKVTIEITEREANENIDLFSDKLMEYKTTKNLKIALDDFGTGYSSLLRLKQMPCDIIKIDISFIREMFKTDKDTVFVGSIIDLAKNFNYITLAEGVETVEQFSYLRKNGCTLVQGYLFSKPLNEESIKSIDWKEFSKGLRETILKQIE